MSLDDALIEAARATPSGWAYVTSRGKSKKPRHIDLVDQKLCDLEARRIRLLFLEMPPRHGKSRTGTEKFPSWYLGRHPDHRVGIVSYGSRLAEMFGKRNRNDMEEWGRKVFGVTVDPRSSAMEDWSLEHHDGGLISVGLTGSITGKGLDLLVIDDPIKNHKEAESETYRENLKELWSSTLRTRLEPGGVVLVIQTRWHEDDLAGWLQANPPVGWDVEVLRLPALAEGATEQNPDYVDPLGRSEGEALWPERYEVDELLSIKAGGSYVWNALYQQRPVAAEGNLLKRSWWKFYDEPPELLSRRVTFDEIIASWDTSFKDTKDSDYVVGQVWGRSGGDYYLLHQVRDQMDYPTFKRAVADLKTLWPAAHVTLIEDKANGSAVIADLRSEVDGLVAVDPDGGKVARVVAISGLVEGGQVFLPMQKHAAYVEGFLAECASFPNGANDDQVDTMSQALNRLKRDTTPAAARNVHGGDASGGQLSRAEERRRKREAEYWGDDDESDD